MMKRYEIVTEHNASRIVYAINTASARKDFESAMPGVRLARIKFIG